MLRCELAHLLQQTSQVRASPRTKDIGRCSSLPNRSRTGVRFAIRRLAQHQNRRQLRKASLSATCWYMRLGRGFGAGFLIAGKAPVGASEGAYIRCVTERQRAGKVLTQDIFRQARRVTSEGGSVHKYMTD